MVAMTWAPRLVGTADLKPTQYAVCYAGLQRNVSMIPTPFTPRKSPFVQCFVRDWAQKCAGKGARSDLKHWTKEFRGPGSSTHGGDRRLRMVGGAVLPTCGDHDAGIANESASTKASRRLSFAPATLCPLVAHPWHALRDIKTMRLRSIEAARDISAHAEGPHGADAGIATS